VHGLDFDRHSGRAQRDPESVVRPGSAVPNRLRVQEVRSGIGFALLTLTLLSGVLFVHNLHAQHQAHTAILSLVAWIIFGVLLIGRWRWGWRGHRAVNLTLLGMVILLLAFFGSKFVLEMILHRNGM
jgi:hypothetical protein